MGDAIDNSKGHGSDRPSGSGGARKPGGNTSERTPGRQSATGERRDASAATSSTDRLMNQPNGSPAGASSAGLGQTGQSAERSVGANPEQPIRNAPPPTPARQPHSRNVNTPPGEPYNDDTEGAANAPRH
jgi:hypothetical protein